MKGEEINKKKEREREKRESSHGEKEWKIFPNPFNPEPITPAPSSFVSHQGQTRENDKVLMSKIRIHKAFPYWFLMQFSLLAVGRRDEEGREKCAKICRNDLHEGHYFRITKMSALMFYSTSLLLLLLHVEIWRKLHGFCWQKTAKYSYVSVNWQEILGNDIKISPELMRVRSPIWSNNFDMTITRDLF